MLPAQVITDIDSTKMESHPSEKLGLETSTRDAGVREAAANFLARSNSSRTTIMKHNKTNGLAPDRKTKIFVSWVLLVILIGIGLGVGLGLTAGKEEPDYDNSSKPLNTTWCGDGILGNGRCENGLCCSPYGFCGFSGDHCVNEQTPPADLEDPHRFCGDGFLGNRTCANSTECCSFEGKCGYSYSFCDYWPWNTTRGEPCGNGDVGDGICETEEAGCCSQWGYCGTTEDHCAPWVEEEDDNGARALRGIGQTNSNSSTFRGENQPFPIP
jgi:hypothetical protein